MFPLPFRSSGSSSEIKSKKLVDVECCGERHEIWVSPKGRLFSPQHSDIGLEQVFHGIRESTEKELPTCLLFITRWEKFLQNWTDIASMIGETLKDREAYRVMSIIRGQIVELRRRRSERKASHTTLFGQKNIRDRLCNYVRELFKKEFREVLRKRNIKNDWNKSDLFLNLKLDYSTREPTGQLWSQFGNTTEKYIEFSINPIDWMRLYSLKRITIGDYLLLGEMKISAPGSNCYLAIKPEMEGSRAKLHMCRIKLDSNDQIIEIKPSSLYNTYY